MCVEVGAAQLQAIFWHKSKRAATRRTLGTGISTSKFKAEH